MICAQSSATSYTSLPFLFAPLFLLSLFNTLLLGTTLFQVLGFGGCKTWDFSVGFCVCRHKNPFFFLSLGFLFYFSLFNFFLPSGIFVIYVKLGQCVFFFKVWVLCVKGWGSLVLYVSTRWVQVAFISVYFDFDFSALLLVLVIVFLLLLLCIANLGFGWGSWQVFTS